MAGRRRVLVVDDEKNIRLTLRATIEPLADVDEASDGTSAVERSEAVAYDLILLDLRLPGADGLDVLRRIRARRPDACVVVVTAHGSVDAAVAAMKLGATDFVQKPFLPDDIRAIVRRTLADTAPSATTATYDDLTATARSHARERQLDAAAALARRAVSLDPSRPQAHHVLGAVHDLRGDRLRAQAFYRAALALDPTYRPSERNLDRSLGATPSQPLLLGDETKLGTGLSS